MLALRIIYLVLVVAGIVMPFRYFIPWLRDNEFDIMLLIEAWHVNNATSGLVWDLTIAAIAVVVWMVAEVYQRKDYWLLMLCIPATFGIGVSCGLPLYLFLRPRSIF